MDHPDRIQNATMVINHLKACKFSNIFIREYHTSAPTQELAEIEGVSYSSVLISDFDNFNKMKCINDLTKQTENEYLAVYDVDAIIPKRGLIDAIALLHAGADVVYPYNGEFYNVPKTHFYELLQGKIDLIDCELCNPNSYGGVVFFNRASFVSGGMCNPNFKNVGFDDNELFMRFSRLGFTVKRTQNPLLHLDHFRSNTSVENSVFLNHNMGIYNHIVNCPIEQLKEEIKTWV